MEDVTKEDNSKKNKLIMKNNDHDKMKFPSNHDGQNVLRKVKKQQEVFREIIEGKDQTRSYK